MIGLKFHFSLNVIIRMSNYLLEVEKGHQPHSDKEEEFEYCVVYRVKLLWHNKPQRL